MRMWEGIEREGAQVGINTLFIESKRISQRDLLLIRQTAKERGISRLYFGANRKNVLHISRTWTKILCDYTVIVETTPQDLCFLPYIEKFNSIILRIDLKKDNYDNFVPKIDNGKKVSLYYDGVANTLDTLKDGLYTDTDKLINI